tara:strand:- start:109 stop:816 length:708 start_codon:yes stop_codon:yes gene_type:complete
MIARQLRFEPEQLRTEQFWQQTDVPNQFWWYRRAHIARVLEQVERATGVPFALAWSGWRFSDASFTNMMAVHHAIKPTADDAGATTGDAPRQQVLRNLPLELERALPEAHARCCRCGGSGAFDDGRASTTQHRLLPCRHIRDVVSPCMLRAAGAAAVASFLIDTLGLFATWFEQHPLPAEVLDERNELSWCVNNCFNDDVLGRLLVARTVNVSLAAALAESGVVRRAFAANKRSG